MVGVEGPFTGGGNMCEDKDLSLGEGLLIFGGGDHILRGTEG